MNGIFLVDKEQDWTSQDVVAKLRGVLHERKVGHAGTLDPMATGLLIVMVGRATKLSDRLMHQEKEYVATMHLGTITDTQDIWGNVLETREVSTSSDDVEKVLKSFSGELMQIPPMYSAIKIKGRKLYDIARKGGVVEREPRSIRVDSITILAVDGDDYTLDIHCSSGTYVRTLCHDIGERLGCGACMSALRRVGIGEYRIEDAHLISEITGDRYLIPMEPTIEDYQ